MPQINSFHFIHFQLDQTDLGLNREFLIRGLDDKVVKAYHDYQVDLAVIFGANRERAEKEMLDALNFEIALANVSIQLRTVRLLKLLIDGIPNRSLYRMRNVATVPPSTTQ